jgi:sterol desaturase/sphingolipid hydroxylase (fatty acid hydroxylase superfamily)
MSLLWGLLVFSYLHDRMHEKGFWMEKNRFTRRWFLGARKLHDIHHWTLNDEGLMDRNFGIGLFIFDRLFGTRAVKREAFNPRGYERAHRRFEEVVDRSTEQSLARSIVG